MGDLKIEMKMVHFDVTARRPTAEEIAAFPKITMSSEKLKRNKQREQTAALKKTLTGLLIIGIGTSEKPS